MALFTLRKGYKVISTPEGARVVDTQGVEQPLTPLEVQILARAAAEGLNHKSTYLPAVIRRLSEQGLLEEVAASNRISAFDELDVDVDVKEVTVTPAASLQPEDKTLALKRGLKMTPDASKGVVQVTDPATGKSFSLYDFEISLAKMLDGVRTVGEIIAGGERIGIPVDLASLTQFLRQLDRYGFLVKPSESDVAAASHPQPPHRQWDEGLRVLFQTGMRLSRQGRYGEAVSYFEAMLQQDPENREAKDQLAKAKSAAAAAAVKDDAAPKTDPAVPVTADSPPPLPTAPGIIADVPPPLPGAAETPDAAPTQPVDLPPAPAAPPAPEAEPSRWPVLLAAVLGIVALAAGAWAVFGRGRPPAPTPVFRRPPESINRPAMDASTGVVAASPDAGAAPVAKVINAGEVDIAVDDEVVVKDAGARAEKTVAAVSPSEKPASEKAATEKTPAEKAPPEKAPSGSEKAPSEKAPSEKTSDTADSADSLTVAVDRRGRATMGEIVADGAGTLQRRAAQEERVKKNQPIGDLKGKPLNAPIAGLVFWQVSADGPVKEGAKLAKLLYHEAYVMGLVQGGSAPQKTWHCELRDGDSGATAPCIITGVEKRAKGWYLTITGEPTWIERTGGLSVRVSP
jgi:hypothetical protein